MAILETKENLSILLYHRISDRHLKDFSFHCHLSAFKEQMQFLRDHQYNVISFTHAFRGLYHGGSLPNKAVVLSFDDGYQDYYDHAYPVLESFGYPSIVFVVSGLIGGQASWLRGHRKRIKLMSSSRLRELRNQHVELGAHGLTHASLTGLDRDQQIHEVVASKEKLEDTLGETVNIFSYPYGDYTCSLESIVQDAGFKAAVIVQHAWANQALSPFVIPRKEISAHHHIDKYALKLRFGTCRF